MKKLLIACAASLMLTGGGRFGRGTALRSGTAAVYLLQHHPFDGGILS